MPPNCHLAMLLLVASTVATGPYAKQDLSREQVTSRARAEQLVGEAATLRAKQDKGSLREAMRRLEESVPLWQIAGDRAGEGTALTMLGGVYRSLGDTRIALERLQHALTLRRGLDDLRAITETLTEAAAVYVVIGETQKALDSYTEARDLARTLGDRAAQANATNGLGRVYDSRGDDDEALDAYAETLELAQAVGDRRAEAAALGNLGRLAQAQGEHQQALEHFRRALSAFQALNDRARQTTAVYLIAAVYHSLGDLRTAIRYYDEALIAARALENRQLTATTLNSLAIAHAAAGDHPRALPLLDEALALARAIGDPRLLGYTLHNLGDVHGALGERRKALDLEVQALPLRRSVGDRIGEARVLIAIGTLSHALKIGEPEQTLNQALRLTRAIDDRAGEALTLTALTLAARDAGRLEVARSHLEAALAITESLRSAIAIHELRTSYLAATHTQYETYVDLLMQLHRLSPADGFDRLALQASERARARTLVELLAQSRAQIRQGVDPALLEREQALRRRLNAKAERQMRLLADAADLERAANAARELEQLTTELHEIEGQIRATSPRHAALTQPQPASVQEIQQQVLDANTLLLEYSLGDEGSYVWAVTQQGVAAYQLPKRALIEAQARRVYELLTARQRRPAETVASARARLRDAEGRFAAEAAALSDMILAPVADHLGSHRLLIVPDGALGYIPFAALPRPQSTVTGGESEPAVISQSSAPLIVSHEVVSIPSASALVVSRRELAGRAPAPKLLAVLADPVFESGDERVKPGKPGAAAASHTDLSDTYRSAGDLGLLSVEGWVPRLPFTRREADGILNLVSEALRLRAVDFQASRTVALSDAFRNYRVIHLATHGFINNEHPELSGVVLSLVDERGRRQDGFVRLHEFYNLDIPAELVVLSACQTALGREARGEGLIGLTRGFMYAGAARVLASLWKVEDAATAELMKRFYAGLFGEQRLSPAAALRAAQIEMQQQRRWAAPYYWAAFVLQGEWSGFDVGRPHTSSSQ